MTCQEQNKELQNVKDKKDIVIFRVKEIQTEVYVYVGGGGGVVRMMGSTNLFQCKNEGQLLADPIDSQFYRGNLGCVTNFKTVVVFKLNYSHSCICISKSNMEVYNIFMHTTTATEAGKCLFCSICITSTESIEGLTFLKGFLNSVTVKVIFYYECIQFVNFSDFVFTESFFLVGRGVFG